MHSDPDQLIDGELAQLRKKLQQVNQEITELLLDHNTAVLRKVAFQRANVPYLEEELDTGSVDTHLQILIKEKHRLREQIGAWEELKTSLRDRKLWVRLKSLLLDETNFRRSS